MSVTSPVCTETFFFGSPRQQLFGALHESETWAQREHGVVLCAPFGQEYIRSHRAFRHLAMQLAREGFPVLRFDYRGTGDSAGDTEGVGLAGWRSDIASAIDLLQERTGVESVCLAGLRLGASLALDVAADRSDVTATILWEPVVSGATYLHELAEQHRELLWRFFDGVSGRTGGSSDEYLGFAIGLTLRADIERLNLLNARPVQARQVLLIESEVSEAVTRLCHLLDAAGLETEYQHIPSFPAWRDDVDKGLVPDQVLKGIVTWAAEVLS